jgi:hypothetical protein
MHRRAHRERRRASRLLEPPHSHRGLSALLRRRAHPDTAPAPPRRARCLTQVTPPDTPFAHAVQSVIPIHTAVHSAYRRTVPVYDGFLRPAAGASPSPPLQSEPAHHARLPARSGITASVSPAHTSAAHARLIFDRKIDARDRLLPAALRAPTRFRRRRAQRPARGHGSRRSVRRRCLPPPRCGQAIRRRRA